MTKNVKKVFAVIDLSTNEKNQKNVAIYAAQFAKHFGLGLVLYPYNSTNFVRGYAKTLVIAHTIHEVPVKVSRKEINKFNFFRSLHDIAREESAEFIVMGVETKSASFFGKAIWSTTQKTLTPTILLPHGATFNPYQRIAIGIDVERKLLKLRVVNTLAKVCGSTINIFVQNYDDPQKEFLIGNSLQHIKDYLHVKNIRFTTEKARKRKNFVKHLCKYSAKNADLLVIEVDPGKIDKTIKQNIEVLLLIDKYAQPVLLTKTKMMGRYQTFNG